jgi:hypothetical protein
MADELDPTDVRMQRSQELVTVRAIAPFEVAGIMEHWEAITPGPLMQTGDAAKDARMLTWAEGLGPCWRVTACESREEYGERFALALFALLKVV